MGRINRTGLTYPVGNHRPDACGTLSMYNKGCRCDQCRGAKQEQSRRLRDDNIAAQREHAANLPITALAVDGAWRADALCTKVCRDGTHDPIWWTGHDPRHLGDVLRICNACPVLDECRKWAFDLPEPIGVWGGTLPRERGA